MIEFRDIIQAAMGQLANQQNMCSGFIGSSFSVATIHAPMNNSNYFYTNSFERYCEYVQSCQRCNPFVHLALKLIRNAGSGSAYDAGWFGLALSSKLTVAAVKSGVPPYSIMKGYKSASDIVAASIRELQQGGREASSLRVDYADADLMQRVVGSFFATFNGGSVYASRSCRKEFCRVILEAFATSTSYGLTSSSGLGWTDGQGSCSAIKLSSTVAYHMAPGFQLSDSKCFGNCVYMNIPAIQDGVRVQSGALVVLLVDDNIEMPRSAVGAGEPSQLLVGCAEGAVYRAEAEHLSSLADTIWASCVDVVMCQKRIHPLLIKLLARRGVLCVPRVSMHHMSFIHKLSGAVIMGNLAQGLETGSGARDAGGGSTVGRINRSFLGLLGRIHNTECFGRQYVAAVGLDLEALHSVEQLNSCLAAASGDDTGSQPGRLWSAVEYSQVCGRVERVSSVFLAAEVENDCVELKYTCEAIFRTLTRLYSDRLLLYGDRWICTAVSKIRESTCVALGIPWPTSDNCTCPAFRDDPLYAELNRVARGHLQGALMYADALEECVCIPADPTDSDDGRGEQLHCAFSHLSMIESVVDAVQTVLDVDVIANV